MEVKKGYNKIKCCKTFEECFNIKDLPIILNTIKIFELSKDVEVLYQLPRDRWIIRNEKIYPLIFSEKFMITYELCKYATQIKISADEYLDKTISEDGTIYLTFTTGTKLSFEENEK